MKTSLRQQLELVRELQKIGNSPSAVKFLRKWLHDHGYDVVPIHCRHYTIRRITGMCTDCGEKVADAAPNINGSEEALEALSETLNH